MTTGKLDSKGSLHIKRAGKLKLQKCKERQAICNDECPHFREPVVLRGDHRTTIEICNGTIWRFEHFKDER
jgi:hypothetical protein